MSLNPIISAISLIFRLEYRRKRWAAAGSSGSTPTAAQEKSCGNWWSQPDGWHMELKYFTDCLRDGIKPDQYQTLESIADTYKMLRAEKESLREGKKIDIRRR